jgi:hypothetical protein
MTLLLGFLFAEEDAALADEIRKQLVGLRRSGLIEMVGSPNTDERVSQEDLRRIDMLLVMLSPDFVATDFFVDMATYADQHKGTRRIVPILLREVEWQQTLPQLANKASLPVNGKAVRDQNVDKATADISREITRAIHELLARS